MTLTMPVAHFVTPQACCDNVLSSVRAVILARDEVFCGALEIFSEAKRDGIGAGEALAVLIPHRKTAVIAAAILVFVRLQSQPTEFVCAHRKCLV